MASNQWLARLGFVLALDQSEFVDKLTQAQREWKDFSNEAKRDSTQIAKAIVELDYATRNYGKSLTKVEQIQEEIRTGKYAQAAEWERAALLKKAAAYDQVASSARKAHEAAMGGKGGLTAHQSAALGYQTTDIVTSLLGGQNPMMVLIQQGGQLRDQFGGFKPLFKGISEVVTVARLAFVGVAGAVAGFVYALEKGSEESAKFRNSMTLTGNFAGITYEKFNTLSEAIGKKYNTSIGQSREVMQALVSSGQFTSQALEPVAAVIAKVAALSGESATSVAQQLIPAFDGSTGSAKRLNDTYHFLTLAQYQHIEALNKQGKAQEAITYTADLLKEKLSGQAEQLGYLQRMWKSLTETASEFFNWAKRAGDGGPLKALKDAEMEMNSAAAQAESLSNDKRYNEAYAKWKVLKDAADAEKKRIEAESAAAAKNKQNIDNYDAAGGAAKSLEITRQTAELKAQIEYETAAAGATKVQQIQLAKQRDIDIAVAQMMKQNADERYVFAGKRLAEFHQKVAQINAKAVHDEKELYKESAKVFRDKYDTELNSIQAERERLDVYKDNILASQQDLDIALSRLKTQQELRDLMKRENMAPEDRAQAAENIKYLEEQRNAVIMQREELKRLQDMNQSVFNNMGHAIDNFVRTGKLSFKDLTRSIIQDLISIAMKAQMMAMFKGFNFFGGGGGFKDVGGMGAASNAALDQLGIPHAAGGTVTPGTTYLVGENGPELFTTGTSGSITPNNMIGPQLGGQPSVVYNGPYIANMSAIDTQSGVQFLAKNKQAVWAVYQSANRSVPVTR